ncbi:TlpA family protein disulfide reductase [Streptomyces platensis]|nr:MULTISPECIES: TlpA disulfide reductase family protein [Streptomyces]MCX4639942.1 TlpA family protein disulfide reductase [Streptomyces platensis]QEV53311.1 TlpA family protein disulfide reductase [Streptomyces platensis]QIY56193.1 TlpA family protein disulfide reductase [Streptomyces sp. RPA4-5]WJY39061.1 TlpA disulfide reductase family protein [Streptomyces sp. P9-2B-2]
MSACRAPRRLTSRRRVALLAAGTAVAALTLSACGDGASGGSAQTRFVQGKNGVDTVKKDQRQPAPELSGESTTGKKLDVADYKGKVVILNVWGSWCGPCIAEAPNFSKVANETKDKGVQFLGINTRDSEKSQATSFEEEHKVPYPSLFDPTGRLMLRFPKGSLNPQSIPSTIAIDRHGKIAARSIGPLAEDDLRKMVEPLIAEK